MEYDVMVSIVCDVYNQEEYVREMLDSLLMQEVDFTYEIVVHDDASTDSTAEIVREYEKRYPQIIKPIYQKENQYDIKDVFLYFQLPQIKGKYIAFCEGDDYWTDPHKLKKQVEAMEKHPELDICAHKAYRVNANTQKIIGEVSPLEHDGVLSTEDVIRGGGGYVATNSILLRSKVKITSLGYPGDFLYDYAIQIQGAERGGMLYLNDCMSAYRVLAKNSWSSNMTKKCNGMIEHLKNIDVMMDTFDRRTDYKYASVIEEGKHKRRFNILRMSGAYKELKAPIYKTEYEHLTWKEKFKINLCQYVPGMKKLIG